MATENNLPVVAMVAWLFCESAAVDGDCRLAVDECTNIRNSQQLLSRYSGVGPWRQRGKVGRNLYGTDALVFIQPASKDWPLQEKISTDLIHTGRLLKQTDTVLVSLYASSLMPVTSKKFIIINYHINHYWHITMCRYHIINPNSIQCPKICNKRQLNQLCQLWDYIFS